MKTFKTLLTLLVLIIFLNEVESFTAVVRRKIGQPNWLSRCHNYRRFGQKKHWATIPGYGYNRCGKIWCVAQPGVHCYAKHHRCGCPLKFRGNGFLQCSDPKKTCLCTIYGDPHVNNFIGQIFTLPLPCSHVITDMTTSIHDGQCKVNIVGRALYPKENSGSPTVSYENQIDIVVESKISRFTARISRSGFSHTNLTYMHPHLADKEPLDLGVQVLEDEAGFNEVYIDECNVLIKYRVSDGSFSLEAPKGCIQRYGLCGKCRPHWDNTPQKPLTPNQQLHTLLSSLSGTSPIDHSDINIYPSCSKLTRVIQTCEPSRELLAFRFCGPMLTDQDIRKCMLNIHSKIGIQDEFTHCFSNVCLGRLPCSNYENIYSGCNANHVPIFIQKRRFCIPEPEKR